MDATNLVEKLRQAVSGHNLEALVACFSEDYRNDTPAHPGRSFVGRDAVRANWERIFAGVPDITATVRSTAEARDSVWSEWEMAGHRTDGTAEALRGVVIFGTAADEFAWGRFYLEPADSGAGGVTGAIDHLVGNEASR
jgi:hypothetical protein